jgi:hypothetical protein
MRRDQAKRSGGCGRSNVSNAKPVSQSAARIVRQRRSLERAGLHIKDAIALSLHQLAGGLSVKIDKMPRRLIAVIVASPLSAAFEFDRESFAGLHA